MREIKFRYWSEHCKKYLCVDEMPIIPEDSESMVLDLSGYDDDCFEQFTGLQDKNGVDIYEGDIMLVMYNDIKLERVVKWDKQKVGFVCCSSEYTVIGNIHKGE